MRHMRECVRHEARRTCNLTDSKINTCQNVREVFGDRYCKCFRENYRKESAKWRAQRAHLLYVPYVPCVLYVPYLSTRPMCPTCSTCPTCPRAQVYFTDRKIKNIGFNEIKWRFVHWCFQGCWILIWTLIKISFF